MEIKMAKSKSVKTVTTTKTSATKIKPVRLNHTQKLVTVMISGKVVTTEEIESLLGDQIQMYKLSTYMWAIKTKMNGTIKVIKEGRKVVGYQLMNPKDLFAAGKVREYLKQNGTITKLEDLGAKEVETQVAEVEVAAVSNEMEITEITE